jgi:glycosyltransferase involved in cell wall biosynthesis
MSHALHELPRASRVAHILPWPTIGGVEQATLRIADAVVGRGFENVAFCLAGETPVQDLFQSRGIQTIGYTPAEPSYRHAAPYLKASVALARQLRAHGVDLVHCSDLLAGYYAGLAARLAGVPAICHIRCEYGAISRRDRSFLRLIGHFAFVSEHTRSAFAYAVPAGRSTVLYDGLDLPAPADPRSAAEVRSEFDIPADVALIGMVARVAPIKDYPTLIRAARQVVDANPAVRFLIVGDHSGAETYQAHYAEVRRALEEQGLAKYFVFTGFRQDVHRLLAAMDVALLVTHSEGLPLVLLEAMAAGKPVVATDVGGIPEVIEHERTGLLHAHENSAELAGAILTLLGDPGRASRLGLAGQEWVRTRFTQQSFASALEQMYRGVAARTGRRAAPNEAIVRPTAVA